MNKPESSTVRMTLRYTDPRTGKERIIGCERILIDPMPEWIAETVKVAAQQIESQLRRELGLPTDYDELMDYAKDLGFKPDER